MRTFTILLLVSAMCLAQAQGHPRLILEAPDFDFGQVTPGTVLKHQFKATNAGDAALSISRLQPECGCTTAVVGKKTLAPGESTELEVDFNTAGESGSVRKMVQVTSDDPASPVQNLYFEARILEGVSLSSDRVLFLGMTRADHPKSSVRLTSGTGQPIRIVSLDRSEAPWLGVNTRADGNDLWVDFDLQANLLPLSRLSGTDTLVLHLANPEPSVVKLDVQWELHAPVTASPERVAWAEPAGHELTATVSLMDNEHKQFRILAATTSNPLLRVAVLSARPASIQAIRLTLSALAKPGTYQEKAYLTLDTPGHLVMEVRVAAFLH